MLLREGPYFSWPQTSEGQKWTNREEACSHIFVLVVSTLDQGRSTLVPDSRRPSCQTGTAGRH
ncbi:hypothetical protein Taro_053410 [Colocasia esculenta]|uniref:Uncharacterized protein n=1 Tax=Colocasia esculenta TaxID=4460 RepID=A0A843XMI3_COLES|nr:hypothetical protein [Colocasia esculenta]